MSAAAALRAHLLGRSLGSLAVDRAIRYAKTLPGVWFATRGEIGKLWMEKKYSEVCTLRKG